MADLFEEALCQAMCGRVIGIGEEHGPQTDPAADGLLQRPHTLDGEAAVVGQIAVGINAAEVLEKRVVAAGNGAEPVAKSCGRHKAGPRMIRPDGAFVLLRSARTVIS